MLVDSHCHLDKLDYEQQHGDVADVLEKAKERGIDYFLSVGVTLDSFPKMMDMIRPYENVFASCGVHPLDIEQGFDFEELKALASDERVVAIGETGLDYHYQPELAEKQQDIFRQHVRLAVELKKPLIIHTRMAREDTLRILREENAKEVGGVLHCFTESLEMAEAAIELGFYISISGIVTFKKAEELKEVVRRLPLERLLVETDSPYLAPVPYRGKQNQPAYTHEVAAYIASLKGTSFETVAEVTTDNFFRLFSGAQRKA
ncbi:metal-dependent hydrolase [Veronia nyctiphanis]|uniref:Metal-dependent hydrolase n=1 Tax=Veronia nyctiphanis TaxID=1278244 RepID=A0A4Q0YUE6_9GAMM|nr:YchF/TatD family DNA exonuclease [Veronia nyctiphanis]RXJ74907.1 metal-dependent hydrolase [Veronia nyctiphanis]